MTTIYFRPKWWCLIFVADSPEKTFGARGLRSRRDEEGHGAAGGMEFEASRMHTLHKPTSLATAMGKWEIHVKTCENQRKTIGKWWFHGVRFNGDLPSGYVNIQFAMENDHS